MWLCCSTPFWMPQPRHVTNEPNNWPQLIGPPFTHILASSLKKSRRPHVRSPLGMLEWFPPMITSRNTSRLIILSSTVLATMNPSPPTLS